MIRFGYYQAKPFTRLFPGSQRYLSRALLKVIQTITEESRCCRRGASGNSYRLHFNPSGDDGNVVIV